MTEIPGSFSISEMLRKEAYNIFGIQGIHLFDSIGESIHCPVHLLHFYLMIDVSPRCISTQNQILRCTQDDSTNPLKNACEVGEVIIQVATCISGKSPTSVDPQERS